MMIGEVRDLFAAVAAFRGAMTGTACGRPCTPTARSALSSAQGPGVDPGLLFDPALLTGLINQSLPPKLCPHCKVRLRPPRPARARSGRTGPALDRCLPGVRQGAWLPGLPWLRGQRPLDRRRGGAPPWPSCVFAKGGPAEARNYWVKTMQGITKHAHAIRRINEACSTRRWSRISLGHSTSMSICSTTASTRRRRADGGFWEQLQFASTASSSAARNACSSTKACPPCSKTGSR